MEVRLLRLLLDDALNEPNEETRAGCFWVHSEDYHDCMVVFKKIFFDASLKSISSTECNVKRIEEGYFIEDPYNGVDVFTHKEMDFIIDLYNQTLLRKPNIIYWVNEEQNENTEN